MTNTCGQSYEDPWQGYVCTHQNDEVSTTRLELHVSIIGLHMSKLCVYTQGDKISTTRLRFAYQCNGKAEVSTTKFKLHLAIVGLHMSKLCVYTSR